MRTKLHHRSLLALTLWTIGPVLVLALESAKNENGTPTSGLCVVIPARDGQRLVELTHEGRVCVQGIALDDETLTACRSSVQKAGLYGVATVIRPMGVSSLPYADNLVNYVEVDLDALGKQSPSQAEILRIVVPNGTARIKQAGEWKALVKPRPAEMDDWTHFDYDAAGTGVSHDKLVAPPNHVQWRLELQEYWGLGGNPAGYRPYTGFRLTGGRAFFLLDTNPANPKGRDATTFVVGRDAFNGLPIWKTAGFSAGSGTPQENQFVASADHVITITEREGYPVALDARTGKVAVTYDQGIKLPARNDKTPPGYTMFRQSGKLVVETGEGKLHVLDAATGAKKWSWEEADGAICFPRVLERERRILAEVVEADAGKIQGRWANLKVASVICLDLDTGKLIWRSRDLEGTRLGQTIQSGERIFGFCPSGIGANENSKDPIGIVVCLDAATGKLLWKGNNFPWGYNLLVRAGIPFFATPDTLNEVDPVTGKINAFWKAPFNNRCNRTAATDDWLIMGLGIFVDKEGTGVVRGVARSGCAQGAFPANGLLYYTPNTCTCITQLRGHVALSAEAVREPVPNDRRLQTGPLATVPFAGKPTAETGPLASEWRAQINNGAAETPPVTQGERTFVSVIHEQRLECRSGDKLAWSFTAGGRISQAPVLHENLCLFGSHDGYVYCLDSRNGSLRWRFLAAPNERNLVSHGQVESSWPVYNVVLHDGRACCAAGLHPEVGGGIFAWGLEPATGKVAWQKTLTRSPVSGKSGLKIAPNRVLNSPLTSDGQLLSIVGLTFSPDEPTAEIQKRIDQGSLGDKNRNLGWSPRGVPAAKP